MFLQYTLPVLAVLINILVSSFLLVFYRSSNTFRDRGFPPCRPRISFTISKLDRKQYFSQKLQPMGKIPFITACLLIMAASLSAQEKHVLVIHGGAGTILKENMTEETKKAYVAALTESLQAGYAVLQQGRSSTEAVVAAITVMEDSPLFNAGKGAVFTHDGRNELDASIMMADGQAGAVAGVTTIKNPVKAALAVMEQSEHVMMVGVGAEQFASAQGLDIVDPSYFHTDMRWDALQRILARDSTKTELDHDQQQSQAEATRDQKYGTVGAVALDQAGDLAAATSTGGMTNKKFGRVGDSPIIGAGTYANHQVGISCTGWGEFFIRQVAAYDVAALMDYKQLPIDEATQAVVNKIGAAGGDGGLIALDHKGNIAMPFNTAGMYRGAITEDGRITIAIYR